MEPVTATIFLGVLSGVITSALLYLCYKAYALLILPTIENILYKGVYIDGAWKSTMVRDVNPNHQHKIDMFMELRQYGYKIKGDLSAKSMAVTKGEIDHEYDNFYKIEGHMVNNYIVLKYHPRSRNRMGLGTLILNIKEGGKRLEGGVLFLDEEDMGVTSIDDLHFHRAKQDPDGSGHLHHEH